MPEQGALSPPHVATGHHHVFKRFIEFCIISSECTLDLSCYGLSRIRWHVEVRPPYHRREPRTQASVDVTQQSK